jgi:hypothetical protein
MIFGMPMNMMLMVCAWGLVQYTLAAIAGAALYKES